MTEEHIDCAQALARLFEFLDAELDEALGDRIREHLAECEDCLTEYDVSDHLKRLVQRSCHELAPAELHERIRAQLVALQVQLGDSQVGGLGARSLERE